MDSSFVERSLFQMHFHSYSFHDLTIFQKPSNVMVFITCRYLNFCYASYLNFCYVLPVVIFNVQLYFYLSEVSVSCIFLPIVLLSVLLYVYLLHLSVHSCIFACCTSQCLYLLVCFWILTVILLSDLLFPYLCTEAGASSTWWGLSLPLVFLRSSALSW